MEVRTISLKNPLEESISGYISRKEKNKDFNSVLNELLSKVNQLQLESEKQKMLLSIGEVDNLHDVTIAAEKANIALQLTLSIRNKIVEAYQEIMRMQI
ncbi:MAG: flagellar hook-basal body complex protein FliE [Tissierellia bacterium]|nr:flagellar hook-basal body complex protein FliE [Tissierellia bacterium]